MVMWVIPIAAVELTNWGMVIMPPNIQHLLVDVEIQMLSQTQSFCLFAL